MAQKALIVFSQFGFSFPPTERRSSEPCREDDEDFAFSFLFQFSPPPIRPVGKTLQQKCWPTLVTDGSGGGTSGRTMAFCLDSPGSNQGTELGFFQCIISANLGVGLFLIACNRTVHTQDLTRKLAKPSAKTEANIETYR